LAIGWFIDGAYLGKVWQAAVPAGQRLSFSKLRTHLEQELADKIDDAYYLSADPDPPTAKANAFHNALAYPPPTGPGLRVKLYWLERRQLQAGPRPARPHADRDHAGLRSDPSGRAQTGGRVLRGEGARRPAQLARRERRNELRV
jgi:hypothetical protein